MRLVTYSALPAGPGRAGVRVGHRILDVETASRVKGEPLPSSMKALLGAGRGALSRVQALAKAATTEAGSFAHAMHEERAIRLLPPVPDAERFLALEDAGDEPASSARATLVGHDARVHCPPGAARLGCAPALAFVIGRRALAPDEDDALDHVVGVTILNEMAAVASMGPEIVTLDELADPDGLWIACSVNGEPRGRARVGEAFSRFPAALGRLAREVPVVPGDIIRSGVPGGSATLLAAGDVVECALEGIATLRTTIVAAGGA